MPVLEFIAIVIVVIIIAYLAIGLATSATIGLAIFVGVCLAIGWVPILMCATDTYFVIGEGFFGNWALISLWIYTFCSIGIFVMMWLVPDPDGLPPNFRFLGAFYSVRDTLRANATNFDPSKFRDASTGKPRTAYGAKMMEQVFKKAETRLRRRASRLESDTAEYLDAARDRANAAEKVVREESRNKAARDFGKEDDE